MNEYEPRPYLIHVGYAGCRYCYSIKYVVLFWRKERIDRQMHVWYFEVLSNFGKKEGYHKTFNCRVRLLFVIWIVRSKGENSKGLDFTL